MVVVMREIQELNMQLRTLVEEVVELETTLDLVEMVVPESSSSHILHKTPSNSTKYRYLTFQVHKLIV